MHCSAQYPDRVTRWVVIDAPLPGIGDWDNIVRSPMLWHFDFRGPDEERLVQGRSASTSIASGTSCPEIPRGSMKTRGSTMLPYTHGRMRCTTPSSSFGALRQDAADNKAVAAKGGKITTAVLAIGAEKFFGKNMADHMQFAASNVTGGIVPNSGHWITWRRIHTPPSKLVTDFLAK